MNLAKFVTLLKGKDTNLGLLQLLSAIFTPPPHVREHSPNLPQSPQFPLTGRRRRFRGTHSPC